MQPGKLLIMVLTLLLGTAAAAPAVSLHTPWPSCQPELNLYQIIRGWGLTVDLDGLKRATPLETLPAGTYVIKDYASDLNASQSLGIYPAARPLRGHGPRLPADALPLLTAPQSGNWACDLGFAETSDFAFFDAIKPPAALLTTQNQNSEPGHHHPAGGLILDLGEINPLYAGEYIIAFEADRKAHSYAKLDYNDLVVHVYSAPLPATLPLVGLGLLGLLIRRWWKLFNPAT